MDENAAIAGVLDGFVPAGADHPKAQELLLSVKYSKALEEIDRLNAVIDELRRNT